MPRYLVERTFQAELSLHADDKGAELCRSVVQTNLEYDVTDPLVGQQRSEKDFLHLRRAFT
jgi:hypothetical protein